MENDVPQLEMPRGRLNGTGPIAVIDIGSNSIRLVIYEHQARTPTALFNEKVLAGLGRGIESTGRIAKASIGTALTALQRFRYICEHVGVREIHVLATAAARDAANGSQFVADVERITGVEVRILNGEEEAFLSAMGIESGFWRPSGLVGDLGGGSLELVEVSGHRIGQGQTFPLGGIRLQEASGGKLSKAQKIVDGIVESISWPKDNEDYRKTFYAVGGTWRSLGRLHMFKAGYPLHVMHGYSLSGDEMSAFCQELLKGSLDNTPAMDVISKQRRPLLPYGAMVMDKLIKVGKLERIVFSATGVREGLLHEQLPEEIRVKDPVIEAARELSLLRSRSPAYTEELIPWTDRLFAMLGIDESDEEYRLRIAGCLLSDIGWRAHPDYRGEQSLNVISNAGFVGLDHPGRAYMALAVFYRNQGLVEDALSPSISRLVSDRYLERARLLGAALRVSSLISASIGGVLLKTEMVLEGEELVLKLGGALANLDGERLRKRMGQLAKLRGLKGTVLPLP